MYSCVGEDVVGASVGLDEDGETVGDTVGFGESVVVTIVENNVVVGLASQRPSCRR